MIERDGPLSFSRQCALLGVSRSSQYYRPKGESAENLALMRRMDELHMAYPFYGSRQLMRHLRREGVTAGRHRIRRLMRLRSSPDLCVKAEEAPRLRLGCLGDLLFLEE